MTKKELIRGIGQKVIPPLVYIIMRLFWFTQRKTFHYITPFKKQQQIYVTWHGGLFIAPQVYRYLKTSRQASAIVSDHFDGQLVATTLSFFGIRPLRGSTSKGASRVLREAFKSLKNDEDVLISPDGPRGPRHTMNDGAIALALKSKLPIFILSFQTPKYWQLKSWDKFVIPKPFSKVDVYMETLSLDGMQLEEAKSYIKSKMLEHTII